MPAHQVDELATVLRLRFELDDDHDLAHRCSFRDHFGHRCAIRDVKASDRPRCAFSAIAVPMVAALFKPFPEKAPTEFGPRGTYFGIG
jgi:hypothetical protein